MGTSRTEGITATTMNSVDYNDTAIKTGTDFIQIESMDVDRASEVGETRYTADWAKWHGFYRTIPAYGAVIDKLATWCVGKGFEAEESVKRELKKIKGFGKDNINSLIENYIRTALICGESYGHRIRDKAGRLTNLKPLNPGRVTKIFDEYGIIERYELFTEVNGKRLVQTKKPDEIFNLSWNRIADEIHGIPFGERIEELLKTIKEVQEDERIVFKRYVKPLRLYEANTDDETELASIRVKLSNAYRDTENLVIPKGTLEAKDALAVPQYATLDPLPYLKYLLRELVTSCGMPEIIMGWGENTTEAASRIIYLAYEQTIRQIQLWFESNFENQLNIKINLVFPASLEQELMNKATKDGNVDKKAMTITKSGK